MHNSNGRRQTLPQCFKCAKTCHCPALCKFKNAKCHHCGKLGHISSACKSRVKTSHNLNKLGGVHHVQEEKFDSD